ncbi:YciI family protein [Agromyces salentinus]|uniref:YciI family protein n=1 Tax=Agromyces salentinus TaxID=269421 RepID=A0ABP4Z9K3_9MICO|nr:YciI family protein [Agromyces salentinus]
MKYMLIMRANDEGIANYEELDFTEVIAAMGAYNESMIKAGVLLAGEGLADAKEGFVVDFDSTPPVVTDGPYAEAKELFNGFWIIGVSSKEEAAEWARRCPLGPGARLEVRRVNELEDFPQDNEWIQKEAGWRADAEAAAAAESGLSSPSGS